MAEAAGKNVADGGNEGAATGKKDGVYLMRDDGADFEEGVDAVLDGGEVICDPGFEFRAGDGNSQVD